MPRRTATPGVLLVADLLHDHLNTADVPMLPAALANENGEQFRFKTASRKGVDAVEERVLEAFNCGTRTERPRHSLELPPSNFDNRSSLALD